MSSPYITPVKRNLVAFVLFFLLAVGGGLGAGYAAYSSYAAKKEFLAHSTRTTGTVTRFSTRTATRGKSRRQVTVYTPEFSYTDGQGRTQRARSTEDYDNNPKYKVNDKVPILYNAANPGEAQPDTFGATWSTTLIFTGLAVLFALGGGLGAQQAWLGKLNSRRA